jgi:hypothetical protein
MPDEATLKPTEQPSMSPGARQGTGPVVDRPRRVERVRLIAFDWATRVGVQPVILLLRRYLD